MSDLATRYGSPRPTRRRALVAVVVVVAAAALSWVVWATLSHGRPLVQSDQVSFEVLSDHQARTTFVVVRRTADVRASCLLRAQAADHTVVGELNVPVGPGSPATARLTRRVRTERLATSVELVGCTAAGQPQRR